MKFLADECIDEQLVLILRIAGYDVLSASESMASAADTELLARAHREDRILLTEDKDFGELVYRLRRPAHGIVLLRFDPGKEQQKDAGLLKFLRDYADKLVGSFAIIEIDKIRLRSLPS